MGMLRCFLLLCLAMPSASAKTYRVYYLGGQSNMDGYGKVSELPADLRKPLEGAYIFHGNPAPDGAAEGGLGLWAPLRPGHGVGFSSNGKQNSYSDRFGVELSFAQRLQKLHPDAAVALIKYSRGGSSLDQTAARWFGSWEADYINGPREHAGVNQYDHFLATLRGAFAVRDIDGDGQEDTLVPAGILWMQGESDGAATAAVARRYEHHLKRLMDLIRAALRVDDLPVAIGRISDSGKDEIDGEVWNHGELIREAQHAFVDSDPAAVAVTSTDEYEYSDSWHYDSSGYLDLGKQFSDALHSLE